MYTRVYQGREKELPEEYHGTAFTAETGKAHQKESGAPITPEERELPKVEPMREHTPWQGSSEDTHGGDERNAGGDGATDEKDARTWSAELLLLVLCALLMESESPDTRLLALLLLLLLSPT